MTVKTDQLIPGEYYLAKYVHPKYSPFWEPVVYYGLDLLAIRAFKRIGHRSLYAVSDFEIHCDTEGNPIAIKRPE